MPSADAGATEKPVSPCRLVRSEGVGCRAVHFSSLRRVLPDYPLVFNTVPAPVMGAEELSLLPPDACVIELASAPGGDHAGDSVQK